MGDGDSGETGTESKERVTFLYSETGLFVLRVINPTSGVLGREVVKGTWSTPLL